MRERLLAGPGERRRVDRGLSIHRLFEPRLLFALEEGVIVERTLGAVPIAPRQVPCLGSAADEITEVPLRERKAARPASRNCGLLEQRVVVLGGDRHGQRSLEVVERPFRCVERERPLRRSLEERTCVRSDLRCIGVIGFRVVCRGQMGGRRLDELLVTLRLVMPRSGEMRGPALSARQRPVGKLAHQVLDERDLPAHR